MEASLMTKALHSMSRSPRDYAVNDLGLANHFQANLLTWPSILHANY